MVKSKELHHKTNVLDLVHRKKTFEEKNRIPMVDIWLKGL